MINFSEYQTIFCDSREVLNYAFKQGLSSNVLIKTSSPALLWDKNLNTHNLDEHWPIEKVKNFHKTTVDFLTELYETLSNSPLYCDYALTISRLGINFQRFLYSAGTIQIEDTQDKRLFLSLITDRKDLTPPWSVLLTQFPSFETFELKEASYNPIIFANNASFFERIILGGFETFLFRIGLKLNFLIPQKFQKKHFYILSENELIIDTAAELLKLGVLPRLLQVPDIKLTDLAQNQHEELRLILGKILTKRMGPYIIPELHQKCINQFFQICLNNINQQIAFKNQWENVLNNIKSSRFTIASNAPHRPIHIALSYLCKNLGIPFIGFQHGTTHEIVDDYHFQKPLYESNISDLSITFNKEMQRIAENNFTKRGIGFTAGLSSRYTRAKLIKKMRNKFPPIAYISNKLSAGNLGTVCYYRGDFERFELELNDLKHLNQISHPVLYKPYPNFSRRYTDPDPIKESLKNLSNITHYESYIDLRYLLGNFKVTIITQATSTLSWVLLSDIPTVFLNDPLAGGLRPSLKELFSLGMFYFCRSDENFYPELKKFLSQDIKSIQASWKNPEKVQARKKIIQTYLSNTTTKPGKVAAEKIYKLYYK